MAMVCEILPRIPIRRGDSRRPPTPPPPLPPIELASNPLLVRIGRRGLYLTSSRAAAMVWNGSYAHVFSVATPRLPRSCSAGPPSSSVAFLPVSPWGSLKRNPPRVPPSSPWGKRPGQYQPVRDVCALQIPIRRLASSVSRPPTRRIGAPAGCRIAMGGRRLTLAIILPLALARRAFQPGVLGGLRIPNPYGGVFLAARRRALAYPQLGPSHRRMLGEAGANHLCRDSGLASNPYPYGASTKCGRTHGHGGRQNLCEIHASNPKP